MDVFYCYTYGTAAWLGVQGISLAAVPEMIIAMLQDEPRSSTNLEVYFARSFGLSLLTVSVICLVLTGSVALTSSYSITPEESDPKAPYAVPTLSATFTLHTALAFYAYTWCSNNGGGGGQTAAFALAMVGYGLLASVGLWCLLFAREGGRISRRTGADKRMSGFPFGNTEADKKRKGEKKNQKDI